ncbi:MAG: hypothetical protein WCW40_09365 [Bacteroidota bacterium]
MNVRLPYPHVVSSIPDFVAGLAFLVTWIDPKSLGDDMVSSLFQVMLLEFIIIHSAGFMGTLIFSAIPKGKKALQLLGLGLLYSLFVAGFAFAFRSWWPVIAFWGLLFNRMMSVLTGQAEQGKEQELVKSMWGVNTGCYLVAVFAAILLPLPALGVSPDDLAHLDISGEFVDEPHRMMAWGFLYFSMVGWFEFRLKKKQTDQHRILNIPA